MLAPYLISLRRLKLFMKTFMQYALPAPVYLETCSSSTLFHKKPILLVSKWKRFEASLMALFCLFIFNALLTATRKARTLWLLKLSIKNNWIALVPHSFFLFYCVWLYGKLQLLFAWLEVVRFHFLRCDIQKLQCQLVVSESHRIVVPSPVCCLSSFFALKSEESGLKACSEPIEALFSEKKPPEKSSSPFPMSLLKHI